MLQKNDIINTLYTSKFIDTLIWTITSGNELKDDLKSELFLILLEMDDKKIINAYNNNYLNYMCVNILKKQYHSKTSPFHKTYRKNNHHNGLIEIADELITDDCELITKILWFVDNKLDLVDRELYKIYYKIGRYDRWLGDLRDTTCTKPTSSLHKVSKKLAVITVGGNSITIGYDTVGKSLKRSILKIKNYLKQNGLWDNYFS